MTAEALAKLQENLGRDSVAFLPELVLCGTIVLLLLSRLIRRVSHRHVGYAALVLTVYALWVAWCQWLGVTVGGIVYDPRLWDVHSSPDGMPASLQLFGGLLVYDNFTI